MGTKLTMESSYNCRVLTGLVCRYQVDPNSCHKCQDEKQFSEANAACTERVRSPWQSD